jgi:hypothetical protein
MFAFTPDGKVLFTIDEEGWGATWDTTKGVKIRSLEGDAFEGTSTTGPAHRS